MIEQDEEDYLESPLAYPMPGFSLYYAVLDRCPHCNIDIYTTSLVFIPVRCSDELTTRLRLDSGNHIDVPETSMSCDYIERGSYTMYNHTENKVGLCFGGGLGDIVSRIEPRLRYLPIPRPGDTYTDMAMREFLDADQEEEDIVLAYLSKSLEHLILSVIEQGIYPMLRACRCNREVDDNKSVNAMSETSEHEYLSLDEREVEFYLDQIEEYPPFDGWDCL